MFNDYLARWNLIPDGDPLATRTSHLLPVRHGGIPAMLKISFDPEERAGAAVMTWWNGDGAARVFAYEGSALLLERAQDRSSLAEFSRNGRDDEACEIICGVVARLHAQWRKPLPKLIPLPLRFERLQPAAAAETGVFAQAHTTAVELLSEPRDIRALHGDIHHRNILDFGARGWLAIDPKGPLGDRGFDYANLFCNPDLKTCTTADIFARRIETISRCADLAPRRLTAWALAWAGLSAAWHLDDGTPPDSALAIANMAAAALCN
jgi:streptomycin 6-kinase